MNEKKHITDFTKSVICFFLFYAVLFIPFPFQFLSFQKKISQFLFEDIVFSISSTIFNIELVNKEITSDTTGMYILLLVLLIIAIITSTVIFSLNKWQKIKAQFLVFANTVFTYYLVLQLFNYGFDKLFKAQFYLPEPNILYTPLGQVSKDLLFWSTMGTSHSYNIFMGMLEVIPAILLLFRKTRILGLLIAFPVLINIVAINFGFDISVKIYSIFLLMLSLYLLFPYLKSIFSFLVLGKEKKLNNDSSFLGNNTFLRTSLKVFFIGVILLETLSPYIISKGFNDDKTTRPYLHGAYKVEKVIADNEIIHLDSIPIKRIFIHRKGYMIFQDKKDQTQDFKLEVKGNDNQFTLIDYQLNERNINFEYLEKGSILKIQYFQNGKEYYLETKALDWRKLPALQNDFHWTLEEIE